MILGNRPVVLELDRWLRKKSGVVFLWGPPGIGKTFLIQKLCASHGLRLCCLECDTYEAYLKSLHNIRADQGIFSGQTIVHQRTAILVEDVDSFFGCPSIRKHLLKFLKTASVPVFLTNNSKVAKLHGRAKFLRMTGVPRAQIYRMLLQMLPDHVSRATAAKIAVCCGGDVRYAKLMLRVGTYQRKDCDRFEQPCEVVRALLDGKKRFSFQELEHAYEHGSDGFLRSVRQKYLRHVRNMEMAANIAEGLSESCLFSRCNQKCLDGHLTGSIVATTLWRIQVELGSIPERKHVVVESTPIPQNTKQLKLTDFFY